MPGNGAARRGSLLLASARSCAGLRRWRLLCRGRLLRRGRLLWRGHLLRRGRLLWRGRLLRRSRNSAYGDHTGRYS
jgi:hypothetical protein